MSLHVVVEGGASHSTIPQGEELTWHFTDAEYEKALAMFHSLVYADRDKGLLLKDGKDGVWLEKISGRKTAWQKFKAAIRLKSGRLLNDGSRFDNERQPGRGTKPPA
jgi:hypothetical protein